MESAVLEIENPIHKTVMTTEVMKFLRPHSDGVYLDATLGLGGHTEAILEYCDSRANVIAFDTDDEAISFSKNRLSRFETRIKFLNSNFSQVDKVLESLSIEKVDGIVADLGMSSFQLEASGRGFSFQRDEKLDMRMDPRLRFTAHDLINEMDEEEISKFLKNYGEERWGKRIAREISKSRKKRPIETTQELVKIVSRAIPKKFYNPGRHPATKTFQALRIAVNNELENLETFLEKAPLFLKSGARIVIISFHSLEDRLVKNAFRKLTSVCICPVEMPKCGCERESILKILTRSPIIPSLEEVNENPKSRSAKLRAGEKI